MQLLFILANSLNKTIIHGFSLENQQTNITFSCVTPAAKVQMYYLLTSITNHYTRD